MNLHHVLLITYLFLHQVLSISNENIEDRFQKPHFRNPHQKPILNEQNNEAGIEASAVIVTCKEPVTIDDEAFSYFEPPVFGNEDTNCLKKIHIKLEIVNIGNKPKQTEFVIIDRVLEPSTGNKAMLLDPYVIEINQEPLYQLYGLKYEGEVNAEAKEEVKKKRDAGIRDCDKAPCGFKMRNGRRIPYSEGFCCSCNEKVNFKRQSSIDKTKYDTSRKSDFMKISSVPDFYNILDSYERDVSTKKKFPKIDIKKIQQKLIKDKFLQGLPNKEFIYFSGNHSGNIRNILHNYDMNTWKKFKTSNHNKYQDFSSAHFKHSVKNKFVGPNSKQFPKLKTLDELNGQGVKELLIHPKQAHKSDQTEHLPTIDIQDRDKDIKIDEIETPQNRGEENCQNEPSSNNGDTDYNDESVHCLQFSDLWYSIYRLSDPILHHSLTMRIYEKIETESGVKWLDLTGGKPIQLGNLHKTYQTKNDLIISYSSNDNDLCYDLDPNNMKLLIPQSESTSHFPETQKGAEEYLIVDDKDINSKGDQCDSIGVGYEAFYNQKHRCGVPKGSCLKNQPSQLWKNDHNCEKTGCATKHFLKTFARVPQDALHTIPDGHVKYLKLFFGGLHKSTINVKLKANENILLRKQPRARITEIYSDATWDNKIYLTIKIQNTALTSNFFYPKLSECSISTPSYWSTISGKATIIPPQHIHTFTLELRGTVPLEALHCTIQANSNNNEGVAYRRVKIKKNDQCICSWHCRCTCFENDGLICVPIAVDQYRAAGFVGYIPPFKQTTVLEEFFFDFTLFGLMIFIILFLLGILKGIIGICCCTLIGKWGLDVLIDYKVPPRKQQISKHCESCIIPFKKNREEFLSPLVEFVINCFFFFTFPVVVIFKIMRSLCCPWFSYLDDDDSLQRGQGSDGGISTISEESEEPMMKESQDRDVDSSSEDDFDGDRTKPDDSDDYEDKGSDNVHNLNIMENSVDSDDDTTEDDDDDDYDVKKFKCSCDYNSY